jgi:hypothetical protein
MFSINSNPYVIENGVAKDMLKASMISIKANEKPQDEEFIVTKIGLQAILSLIPKNRLEDLGVIEPL